MQPCRRTQRLRDQYEYITKGFYSNGKRCVQFRNFFQSNTTLHRHHYLEQISKGMVGLLQKGPFSGCNFWTNRGPIRPRKTTPPHIQAHRTHLPLPLVLFSAAQAFIRCPPANSKKVWMAITRDQTDDATSPTLMKNPCTLHANPGHRRFVARLFAHNTHPIDCTRSKRGQRSLRKHGRLPAQKRLTSQKKPWFLNFVRLSCRTYESRFVPDRFARQVLKWEMARYVNSVDVAKADVAAQAIIG